MNNSIATAKPETKIEELKHRRKTLFENTLWEVSTDKFMLPIDIQIAIYEKLSEIADILKPKP